MIYPPPTTAPDPISAIILAGSSNLHLWPRSRIHSPIQFQRAGQEHTPFQKCLLAANCLSTSDPILVTVASGSLEIARNQIDALSLHQPPAIIVEPTVRNNVPALLSAAFVTSRRASTGFTVIMEAQCPPVEVSTMVRVANHLSQCREANHRLVLATQSASSPGSAQIKLNRGAKVSETTLYVASAEDEEKTSGTEFYAGMAFARSSTLLRLMAQHFPSHYSICDMMIQDHGLPGETIWPPTNLWSTMQPGGLAELIESARGSVLLRPVDFMAHGDPKQTNAVSLGSSNCTVISDDNHLIALAGCENLRVVSTDDATLISPTDHAIEPSELLSALHQVGHASAVAGKDKEERIWGDQTRLDEQTTSATWKLEIAPGEQMRPHLHTQRDEHWHILSGHGVVSLDGTEWSAAPGNSFAIPRHTVHTIANTSETKLTLLEIRHGSSLSNQDTIRTASPRTAGTAQKTA